MSDAADDSGGELARNSSRVGLLYNVADGEFVHLWYDSSYGGENHVTGTVRDASLGEWTRIESDDATYKVIGTGIQNYSTGDVVKETDNRRQKVGTFTAFASPNERVSVTIYGHAYTSASVEREDWEGMTEDQRREWCRDHWTDLTPAEPDSYVVDELDDQGGW